VDELARWIDEHKLVTLMEEGRDEEVDIVIANKASKLAEALSEETVDEAKVAGNSK
jgi:dsDNA-binding SOS-regulon protein